MFLGGSSPLKVPAKKSEMEIEFEKNVIWDLQVRTKFAISGTNVVAMARHGPILKDNEATGSGKVFKYLPDLQDIFFI